jgi:hypothetical protein
MIFAFKKLINLAVESPYSPKSIENEVKENYGF